MSNENFNCYNFFVDSGNSPDGSFEKGALRKYLSEEMSAQQASTVFQETLDGAAQNFLQWLNESIEYQKTLVNGRNIASALTVELKGCASQDGITGSASFTVKYKGSPLPDLICRIEKRDRLPDPPGSSFSLMQKVKIGSRRVGRFDSAEGAIFWYIERAREMQRA